MSNSLLRNLALKSTPSPSRNSREDVRSSAYVRNETSSFLHWAQSKPPRKRHTPLNECTVDHAAGKHLLPTFLPRLRALPKRGLLKLVAPGMQVGGRALATTTLENLLPCLIETFTVRRDGGIMYTYIPPPDSLSRRKWSCHTRVA